LPGACSPGKAGSGRLALQQHDELVSFEADARARWAIARFFAQHGFSSFVCLPQQARSAARRAQHAHLASVAVETSVVDASALEVFLRQQFDGPATSGEASIEAAMRATIIR
jgi:hypothetical protein